MDWFKIGKQYIKAVYCHPACLIYMQKWLTEWTQAGIKIARKNINNLRYTDETTLMTDNKEELKSLLVSVKEESEKTGLTLNIQKTKIMTSSPITSWLFTWSVHDQSRDTCVISHRISAWWVIAVLT